MSHIIDNPIDVQIIEPSEGVLQLLEGIMEQNTLILMMNNKILRAITNPLIKAEIPAPTEVKDFGTMFDNANEETV
jgi:hypothetical protein